MERTPKYIRAVLLAGMLFFLAAACPDAFSGEFGVSPMGLTLSRTARTGMVTVANEGQEQVTIQAAVSAWSQDGNGKEVYSETKDIVFYPKLMEIGPNSQQVLRIGYQGPVPSREKAYRLFIREIPGSRKKKKQAISTDVDIAIQFNTPLFIAPAVESIAGDIEKIELARGELRTVVRNSGTVHFRVGSIKAVGRSKEGDEVFSKEIAGWYVLQGSTNIFKIPVPEESCARLATIDLSAQAGPLLLSGSVHVQKEMCR